jgi:hypothetical protein
MPAYDDRLFSPPAPLAKVTIRNQTSRMTVADVPMLLDSGADVSLLPQVSVNLPGVAASANETYDLVGFDGSMSQAQAVRLDLIFLRRTFKGRFLLIDQEWGILGRDVLNHLSLLLDGPQLTWDYYKQPIT